MVNELFCGYVLESNKLFFCGRENGSCVFRSNDLYMVDRSRTLYHRCHRIIIFDRLEELDYNLLERELKKRYSISIKIR